MLKSLYPRIQWDNIQAVGFDMDGTLYDEFEFISIVYKPIAIEIARHCGVKPEEIHNQMSLRWLEKGSSYNRIFSEILEQHDLPQSKQKEIIGNCLKIYRTCNPDLALPVRVEFLLNMFSAKYPLFLITDGNNKLQAAKFKALGLSKWFSPEQVVFTDSLGANCCKPSVEGMKGVQLLGARDINSKNIVFFGDREIDRRFANNAGFEFVQVNCMFPANGDV